METYELFQTFFILMFLDQGELQVTKAKTSEKQGLCD